MWRLAASGKHLHQFNCNTFNADTMRANAVRNSEICFCARFGATIGRVMYITYFVVFRFVEQMPSRHTLPDAKTRRFSGNAWFTPFFAVDAFRMLAFSVMTIIMITIEWFTLAKDGHIPFSRFLNLQYLSMLDILKIKTWQIKLLLQNKTWNVKSHTS